MRKPVCRIAVFPGQFDPITNGHLDVIHRGIELFDQLIVAVGNNPEKKELFSQDERVHIIRDLVREWEGVSVESYNGLTVDFVRQVNAKAILRGIRDASDLRYEFHLAMAKRALGGVETVFIMTSDNHALTSSSLIRQIVALGGDVRKLTGLLPKIVIKKLLERQKTHHDLAGPVSDVPLT